MKTSTWEEVVALDPDKVARARSFSLERPPVHSPDADARLAASLRRIGVDEETVLKLTGHNGRTTAPA